MAPPQPERRPGLLVPPRPKRPDSLVPLYISLAALNVLDVHSTRAAVAQGGVEFNPVLKPFAGSSAALLAVKAASTTGMIFAAEKIRKKNPAAAVAFMVAANSAMIWVVQHNYRAAR